MCSVLPGRNSANASYCCDQPLPPATLHENLARTEFLTITGLVVVPPDSIHAFGASADGSAEFFAVLTRGQESMDPLHEQYDVHFDGAPRWR